MALGWPGIASVSQTVLFRSSTTYQSRPPPVTDVTTHPQAPALESGDGGPLSADELPTWLRRARLVSLSLETNGGTCRDLLKTRYREEEVAA